MRGRLAAVGSDGETRLAELIASGLDRATEPAAMPDGIDADRVGYGTGMGRTARGTTELADALAALVTGVEARPA